MLVKFGCPRTVEAGSPFWVPELYGKQQDAIAAGGR